MTQTTETAAAYVRDDGRSPTDMRPISISFPRLTRVDGSARFAFGPLAALASLTGPSPIGPQHEHAARGTLDVLVRPRSSVPGPTARAYAGVVRAVLSGALELGRCPRAGVGVVVQMLGGGGGAGGYGDTGGGYGGGGQKRVHGRQDVLVNAASCAALCAASVPLTGVPVALCVACIPRSTSTSSSSPDAEDTVLVLDPTDAELAHARASGVFAFVVAGKERRLVSAEWRGRGERLEAAIVLARGAAGDVVERIRGAFGDAFGREEEGAVKVGLGSVEGEKAEKGEEDSEDEGMET